MAKSIELYTGSGIRQKADSLIRQCLEQNLRGEEQSLVFVVPTHRYALEIIHRQREEAPRIWRSPAIFSLDRFLRMFLNHNDLGKRILSDEESVFILLQIVTDQRENFTSLFSKGGDPFPNLIQSALKLIRELKTSGIKPKDAPLSLLENREEKIIQQLYLRYEAFLRQYRFLDNADIFQAALDNLSKKTIEKNFPGMKSLVLDGIDIFPGVLIEFLKKIGSLIPETIALLEYEDQRKPVFKHIEEAYHALSSCASRLFLIEEESAPSPKKAFMRALYNTDDDKNLPVPGASDFLKIYSLPDRLREVAFIARMVKRLIVQEQVSMRDICVCFPNLDMYAPLAREVFDSYGIPFNLSLGLSLSRIPIIRAIDQFLTLIETDFERSRLMRFLNNPYFSLAGFSEDATSPSPDSMIRRLKPLRVMEGGSAWIDSLKKSKESFSQKILLVEKDGIPQEDDATRDEILEQYRIAIDEHAGVIAILNNLTSEAPALDGKRPFSFYSKYIKKSLDKLRIRENLLIPPYEGADCTLFQRDIKALGHLFEIMDRLDVLSNSLGDHPVTPPEYIRELRNVLNRTDIYPDDNPVESVRILGRLEPRLFSFRYFFLGGFLEGEFPRSADPFLFLKMKERKKLGLSARQDTLAADRFLFYHFLRQTKERFIITYPLQKDETPLLPSPILGEIQRVSGICVTAPEPDENPYSEQELRIKLGKEAGEGGKPEKWRGLYDEYVHEETSHCPREKCEAILKCAGQNGTPRVMIPPDHSILKNSHFSPSQLEEYGRCPFHYYATRILRLHEPEEMEEEISPLERGDLIHRALFRFYSERAQSGNAPIRTQKEAQDAIQRLVELAKEEMEKIPYLDMFWEAEKERMLGGDHPHERPGILRIFIRKELQFFQNNDPGYLPEIFEVAFGRVPGPVSEHDPLSSTKPFRISHAEGAIHLRGKIDRVEICGDYFAVVDYKTGSSLPTYHDLEQGTSLQLAVYLMAIREKLSTIYGRKFIPAGGIFYQINREDRVKRDSQLILKSQRKPLLGSERKRTFCENEAEMERCLEMAKDHVKNHVTGIRKGVFPLSSLSGEKALCGVCAFRLSCRRRMGRLFRRK
ncbi:exodeoxyribonuclease V subunit gamma [Candidatus Sumerlaeota bacterium]|nr:exodeoxyribonuclease V subunit gamma [Candidatus Sumerlaeota bacterium]